MSLSFLICEMEIIIHDITQLQVNSPEDKCLAHAWFGSVADPLMAAYVTLKEEAVGWQASLVVSREDVLLMPGLPGGGLQNVVNLPGRQ